MKKYLLSLIPLVICVLISAALHYREAAGPGEELVMYRSRGMLNWLRDLWLIIGATVSGILISCMLIDDTFNIVEKFVARRRDQKKTRD